jgi:hypothetical protein
MSLEDLRAGRHEGSQAQTASSLAEQKKVSGLQAAWKGTQLKSYASSHSDDWTCARFP